MDHGCTKESEEGGSCRSEAPQAPQEGGGSGGTGGSAEAPQASPQVSDAA
jgi:hypothetical protein